MVGLLAVGLAVAGGAWAADPGQSEEPPVIVKILDLLIVRPLSASVATISTALCIVVGPAALVYGVPEAATRVLVEAPWRFTGARPLGDFSGQYKDGKPITTVRDQ